jgi:ribosome biogenesis GTPase
MEKEFGKIIRIDLDLYIINLEKSNNIICAKARGNAKKQGSILVGDIVEVEKIESDYMIVSVVNRQNSLIRPPVSNIDQMIIVVSIGAPSPDFILLDKQIILCKSKNIVPIICVNKIDLINEDIKAQEDLEYIKNIYGNLGIQIVYVSAKSGQGIDELKELLIGKTSAFSGNSGVGKSSITKEILNKSKEKIEIGDIGQKSRRGKHTTKSVTLYSITQNSYILDTPGFSSYELYDVDHKVIRNYYPEFLKCKCDYDDCAHVIESDKVCDVKRNVETGNINQGRYDRYVYIYNKLKEKYDKRYK